MSEKSALVGICGDDKGLPAGRHGALFDGPKLWGILWGGHLEN